VEEQRDEGKFSTCGSDVDDLGQEIIAKYRQELAEARIQYLYRHGGWSASGKVVAGEAYKVDERKQAGGYEFDFEIVLNKEVWQDAEQSTKRAILHHQLCHCVWAVNEHGEFDANDDGSPKWRKQPHDFGDFHEVVKAHGTDWHEDLRILRRVMEQPRLPGVDVRVAD